MRSEENSDESSSNDESNSVSNVTFKRDTAHIRRVSFPENDTDLVTGYMEPIDPLRLAVDVNKDELLKAYESSCEKHSTRPIETVMRQIHEFNTGHERIERFSLSKEQLTCAGCESLEEIFKRVQFNYIDLSDCDLTCETALILFEMFEYYESAIHLNLSNNLNLDINGWQACGRYLKKTNTLEELETRDIRFTDIEFSFLIKPLTSNRCLQILKLDNCHLSRNRVKALVDILCSNVTVKELYLTDNRLTIVDAIILSTLLKCNKYLKILDLSNNQIESVGANHILQALLYQPQPGFLEMLVLWNNGLTSLCASHLEDLLIGNRGLSILNIGQNDLKDEFVSIITESLKQNQSVLRLGLQATNLTCTAAKALADVLKVNKTIERIDLRENHILTPGLRALSETLDSNESVIQIDLNEGIDDDKILIQEIAAKCTSNQLRKSALSLKTEASKLNAFKCSTSRKISLTCQTLGQSQNQSQEPLPLPLLSEPKRINGKLRSPAPSPIPSPVSSPLPLQTKSRFSVSRVYESDYLNFKAPAASSSTAGTSPSSSSNRFTVTVVEPSTSKSVPTTSSSNSIIVTVGFDCSPAQQTTNFDTKLKTDHQLPSPSQSQSEIAEVLALTPAPAEPADVQEEKEKPMTSLERLLNLFQAPTTLFSRSSSTSSSSSSISSSSKSEHKCVPLSDLNTNKNVCNISHLRSSDSQVGDMQSMKENISPEVTAESITSTITPSPSSATQKAIRQINDSQETTQKNEHCALETTNNSRNIRNVSASSSSSSSSSSTSNSLEESDNNSATIVDSNAADVPCEPATTTAPVDSCESGGTDNTDHCTGKLQSVALADDDVDVDIDKIDIGVKVDASNQGHGQRADPSSDLMNNNCWKANVTVAECGTLTANNFTPDVN